jgi:hypothetical protein
MTKPKNARSQPGGGRKYVWQGMGELETFFSVTTILSRVLAKPAIPGWAARTCGEYVAENMNRLYAVWKNDRATVVKMVKEAPWSQRDSAAVRGTGVHDLLEQLALGQSPTIPGYAQPYVDAWQRWRDRFGVEPVATEATVYDRRRGYAGTLDLIADAGDLGRILVDYKTSKDVYSEATLQLTAYRWAEFVGMPDGRTEEPMPEVTGTYVLRLSPDTTDGFDFVPVKSDQLQELRWNSVLDLFAWTLQDDLIGASMGEPPPPALL